jgi:hypothetical protein
MVTLSRAVSTVLVDTYLRAAADRLWSEPPGPAVRRAQVVIPAVVGAREVLEEAGVGLVVGGSQPWPL